ncbi:uncharacterized protein LOC107225390 [Neodiprion lecontei]|uniref:Uncharacterized protein LOC107225390 n=1 Tax=Neodiprion lecontei TaxID=441921 RepID=A0A6J0C459_NEOLC|nr:uncharacterized protein LOC107225390 [Neodiprion lecontei]
MNLIITVLMLAYAGWSSAVELKTFYEWKYIDYVWENDTQKQEAIKNEKYNYTKIIPFDFAKISGERVLVTTPRLFNNPASLSTISNQTGDGGPLLEPYPNWDWHTSTDCTGITSVNRVYLDNCNRLWIVDSGKIGNVSACPAKIIAFDAETDEVLEHVIIPDELTHNSVNTSNGRLEIQAVETSGDSCNETWLYIGDPEGYGLVIWNGSTIWRLENDNVYAPDPTATDFSVAKENVTLELGIFNVEITPTGFIEQGYLLFAPLASKKGYAATLDDFHNSNTAGNTITYYITNFTFPSQVLARVYSKSGVLIGAGTTRLVVSCWNLQYPLASEYVGTLLEDDDALQFASAAKIINGSQVGLEYEQYWVLTNRLQKLILGIMDFEDINFRILGARVAKLVNGTVCEPKTHNVSSSITDKLYLEFETDTIDSSAISLESIAITAAYKMNLILMVLLTFVGWTLTAKLETLYQWKYVDYVWENDTQKQEAIESGVYNHTKICTLDFQRISGNRILVTTPKHFNNPASLSTISNQTGDGGPLLAPYPSWDWHTSTDCSGIVSAARLIMDKCNRLWTVDSGKIGDVAVCPAKIIAFNPETDEVLEQIIIPDEVAHSSVNISKGRLAIQAVETSGDSCNTTWVYIGDPIGYGLVIWNGSAIWRLEDDDVYAPDPASTLFSIGGENITLELGASNVVILPPGFLEQDYLLVRPLASKKSYAASLDDLHNSNTAGNTITYYRSNFTFHSQLLARAASDSGVVVGLFGTPPVTACWNLQYPWESEYVSTIIEEDDAILFSSTAKILNGIENSFEYEQFWLMTNQLQKFLLGTMNFEEVNFRILVATVADLVNGTICEPEPHTISTSIEDKLYFELKIVTVSSSAISL